jgi:pilus assembly protein CpaC
MRREVDMTSVPTIGRTALARRLLVAALLAMLGTLAPTTSFAAQNYLRVASMPSGINQSVSLEANKSMIVDLPSSVGEVIASQPAVASVLMRTKTRAIIQGIAPGSTNIFFLDGAGNNIAVLDMSVIPPPSDVAEALERTIARVIPGSHVKVESLQDHTAADGKTHFVLTGTVLTAEDKATAEAWASQLSQDTTTGGSLIQVIGPQQVMLKVVVAEVDRTAIKQYGLDLNVTSSGGLITSIISNPNQNLGGVSGGVAVGTVTGSATIGPVSISGTLKALAKRNALRLLAQPTLTAMSGQPAEFLAGGEFPYATSDGNGHVVTAFKEYGVKLNFTPTIKSNGSINLLVDTNVSEPSGGGAVTERGAKTTVEIPAGCTLAIGGLLQDNEKHQLAQFPGIGDIPIIGALFRSRDYIHEQTELVIMVTPEYAQTGRPDLPTDNYNIAGDAEAVFLGHLEKQYGVGNEGMRGSYQGSVGFILD